MCSNAVPRRCTTRKPSPHLAALASCARAVLFGPQAQTGTPMASRAGGGRQRQTTMGLKAQCSNAAIVYGLPLGSRTTSRELHLAAERAAKRQVPSDTPCGACLLGSSTGGSDAEVSGDGRKRARWRAGE
eukprot:5032502-Pyramimonas_sp.AAC.1